MSVVAMTYKNPFPFFFLIMVLALIVVLFLGGYSEKYVIETQELSVSEIHIIEVLSGHAWANHGVQVNKAFQCLGERGTSRSFKTTGFTDKAGNNIPTNLWMCFDGNDWYSIVTTTFQKVGYDKTARLVTAYKVAKDIFPTIEDYIKYISEKWGAFEIKYAIEAGNFYLQPK